MTKVAIPSAPSELEELLNDKAKVGELLQNGQFGDVVKAYAANVREKDQELTEQIKAQVQIGLADMLKENQTTRVPGTPGNKYADRPQAKTQAAVKNGLYNEKAPGAALDDHYAGLADYFRTISPMAASFQDSEELGKRLTAARKVQNSYGSVVPADGGFLIPEQLRSDLLMIALEKAIIRPRATVIPMESLRTLIPAVDSTSNASSVFGGVVAYWTEESAALTESQATFARIALEAKKLTALAIAPNELVADSTAFNAFIQSAMPQALAYYEDVAFISGTGVGEPLGILNAPAKVTTTAESGQGAGTIVWENILKMYARMLPSSLGNAVWLVNQEVFPQLATMALSVGTGGAPVWLPDGTGAPTLTLLGRPVIVTEKMSALGTEGDIVFADLSYYLIGDRQAVQVAASSDYRFGNDQTAYRVIERVDGRPWLNTAITPRNGSSTLSPIVTLSSTRT